MPLEIFYGTIEEPLTRHEAEMARQICAPCPVWRDCAITSLRDREPDGIWAGLSRNQRLRLLSAEKGDWRKAIDKLEAKRKEAGHACV